MATVAQAKFNKNLELRSDDFAKYLKQQCVKPTFNGTKLSKFSWYKKVLGL